ncbi:MAG: MurR/RpiR family transcriptional regulator [Ignavibacteriales bacterium]|nr:MurR/RpiR family transcriptional regulator [Ignavibacteriales bacterium]
MSIYKEIKDKIEKNFHSLPQNQRKIAEYFIDNFDKIPFLTVHQISESTEASVASIVRFAQRVGFSGFSEMRVAITDSLQTKLKHKQTFPLFDKRKADGDILTSVANIDIKNINDTLSLIEREKFDEAIDLILKSKRIFTAGLGISYLLAEILAYQLTQVSLDSSVLKHTHTIFQEQILYLNKNDLLITFSFPPYSIETIDAAQFAKRGGIKVISVTNKQSSPITFHSEISLTVNSENMLFTNSFAAISVLINAIATACALKNKTKVKKIIKESGRIMTNQNLVMN